MFGFSFNRSRAARSSKPASTAQERADALLYACELKCERLEGELEELRKKKKLAKPNPSMSIDKKGAATALGSGAVCAPVGAWAENIVETIYQLVDESGSRAARIFFHLDMIEDLTGALIGFIVGTIVVGAVKFFKRYG